MADSRFVRNLILKALLLLLFMNLVYVMFAPLSRIGSLSAYNWLFPGRLRLPYGEEPEKAYNLSLFELEPMFASHKVAAQPAAQPEYRIFLIGDSSVWGYLLRPEETLAAALQRQLPERLAGRNVQVYNLGYPTISLTKDLMFLDQAMQYQPDFIVWLTTLEAFPDEKQLASPVVQHNPERIRSLIEDYALRLDPRDPVFPQQTFWSRTILGQRRALADWFRLQVYGVMWAATGIDQYYSLEYDAPQNDFAADERFYQFSADDFDGQSLSFDVLQAGIQRAGEVPILVVNEPIFIANGQNSHLRYNFFYPRWAYDRYRVLLREKAFEQDWALLDAWDLAAPAEFTNSAIHLSAAGEEQLAGVIGSEILKQIQGQK